MAIRSPEALDRMRAARRRFYARHSGVYHRIKAHNRRGPGKISRAEWLEILEAFDNRCAYCGARDLMTIDHVVPIGKGGRNEAANVVPACGSCNFAKGNRGPLAMITRAFSLRIARTEQPSDGVWM